MKNRKRIASLVTALVMVISMMSVAAFADEPESSESNGTTQAATVVNVSSLDELEAAIKNASGSTEIVFTGDITGCAGIKIAEDKNITIDLNGHSLEAALRAEDRHYYAIDNYGTFTLKDSVGTGFIAARGIENLENGVMYMEGGTIKSIDPNGGAAIWNEATLYFNDGALETTHVGSPNDSYGPGGLNNQGSAVITGGTFNSVNRRAYAIISSGIIEITPSDGKTVTVTGAHGGLAIDGGTAVVNGGSYTSTDYYGLYVSNDGTGTDPKKAQVIVNGGIFDGKSNSVWIGSDVNSPVNSTIEINGGEYLDPLEVQKNVESAAGITVMGGTFSKLEDATKYISTLKDTDQNTVYTASEKNGKFIVEAKTYTVTYYDDQGNPLGTETVKYGETPKAPTPAKLSDGVYTYAFAGWVDEDGNPVDVGKVSGAKNYKASYTATLIPVYIVVPTESEPEPVPEPDVTITDEGIPLAALPEELAQVTVAAAVELAVELGVIDVETYEPKADAAVETVTTALAVIAGDEVEAADVAAIAEDIGVDLTAEGVTREQLVTVLFKLAEVQGFDVSAAADLSGFTDAGDLSDFAVAAMKWAVEVGLLKGVNATTLAPGQTLTQEQLLIILARFAALIQG